MTLIKNTSLINNPAITKPKKTYSIKISKIFIPITIIQGPKSNEYSAINNNFIISQAKTIKKDLITNSFNKITTTNKSATVQNKIQTDLIRFKNKLELYYSQKYLDRVGRIRKAYCNLPHIIYLIYLKSYKRRILYKLRRFRWLRHFYLSIKIVNRATFLHNSTLLAKFCAWQIKKDKRHKHFIFFITEVIRRFFKYRPHVYGIRLLFKGRIQGSTRSRKVLKKFGRTPLQSLHITTDYCIQEAITRYGLCSIKVWFFYI